MSRKIQSLKKTFALQRKKEKMEKEFKRMNLLGRGRYIDDKTLPIYKKEM